MSSHPITLLLKENAHYTHTNIDTFKHKPESDMLHFSKITKLVKYQFSKQITLSSVSFTGNIKNSIAKCQKLSFVSRKN